MYLLFPIRYLLITFFFGLIRFSQNNSIVSPFDRLIEHIEKSGGYVSKDLSQDTNCTSNRRIIALKDLPKDTRIVFLPEKLAINIAYPEINSICKRVMSWEINSKNEVDCLTYFLTIDRGNPKSIFQPYYDSLPIGKETFPWNYDEMLSEEILGTEVDATTFYLKQRIYFLYQTLQNSLPKGTRFETFQDTFLTVISRNFAPSTNRMFYAELLPLIDLFNHNITNTFLEYDNELHGYVWSPIRDIKANEEVYVNYGKADNSELLTSYGYTWKSNKNTMKFTFKCNNKIYKLCYTDYNSCWNSTINDYYALEKKNRTVSSTLSFFLMIHDEVGRRAGRYDNSSVIIEKYNKAVKENDMNMVNIYTVKKEEVHWLKDMSGYWTDVRLFMIKNEITSMNCIDKLRNITSTSAGDDNIITLLKSIFRLNDEKKVTK